MGSQARTLDRMARRVDKLSNNLTYYLRAFEKKADFEGPALYFHSKALAIRKKYATVTQAIESDELFDWLYATLTAWGLHRGGNTRLVDLEKLKASFRAQKQRIQDFEAFRIVDIGDEDISDAAENLWDILSLLRVSTATTQIISNSKALHHLLPSLVPPIDRMYTFQFFYHRPYLSISEEDAFQEMYPHYHRIATANREQIRGRLANGWNTSETKVIDNAIMGYIDIENS